jgi:hypothetical protein
VKPPIPGSPLTPICPLCGKLSLLQIHRRGIDHVLGVFGTARRFQCQSFHCQWQGNLVGRVPVKASP